MMREVSPYAAAIGALLLTLMAMTMAWLANRERLNRQLFWIAAILIVGVFTGFFSVFNQQLLHDEMGGDHFCFVSALYGPGMDPRRNFPLVVTNPGDLPLYDVALLIWKPDDFCRHLVPRRNVPSLKSGNPAR
jgi:hypothetical protein